MSVRMWERIGARVAGGEEQECVSRFEPGAMFACKFSSAVL